MALRESGRTAGETYELGAVTARLDGATGVEHGEFLCEVAEAVLAGDHEAVAGLRSEGLERLGAEGFVGAIAVAAGFNGINRVADAIGIPLDDRFDLLETEFWDQIGIDRFAGARTESARSSAARPRTAAPALSRCGPCRRGHRR